MNALLFSHVKAPHKHNNAPRTFLGFALLASASIVTASDFTNLSLEELMTLDITSVAKKSQSINEAAAAIFVINQQDIHRSGMTSIPELLRLVPGMHVAHIDANKWAISSRGFNDRWANKLLVLIDGRTVYTPLYSGVYWDNQLTPLEDIDRIEVIRGPGGTVWGSNAVNGVINIITKHSRDTPGGSAAVIVGNQEKGVSVRYGKAIGENGWFRAYIKAQDFDHFVGANTSNDHDAWDNQLLGFRADWAPSTQDTVTLQGDLYTGNSEQMIGLLENVHSTLRFIPDTADFNGGNLLLRWSHHQNNGSEWQLQSYFDRTERDDVSISQRIDTFDLDFHYRFQATEHQEVSWGLGYRHLEDDIDNSFTVSFTPNSHNTNLISGFIQTEVRVKDNLSVTLGSKFEHNDFTSDEFESQPSIRALWQVSNTHTLWGAISCTTHTPSRTDKDIRLNVATFSSPFVDPDGPFGPLVAGDPTLISIFGNDDIETEKLTAFEIGYRGQPHSKLAVDAAIYYNQYDNLISSERSFGIEPTPLPTHALISSTFDNKMEGESYGLELTLNMQLMPTWQLSAGYSWQTVDVRLDSTSTDTVTVADREGTTPKHMSQLRSRWDLRDNLELDVALYYVGTSSDARGIAGRAEVPAYTRLDARLDWHLNKKFELSLVLQNLQDGEHPEALTTEVISSEVPRSFHAQMKMAF